MAATKLQNAHTELEDAVETADDDVRDDLRDAAGEFAELASDADDLDHAVLDTHLNTLRQLKKRAGGETESAVDRALEHAEDYRENLEQA
ncbi:DUF7553 family protein [Halostagnicola bangensis]